MIKKYKNIIYILMLFLLFCIIAYFIKNYFTPFFLIVVITLLTVPIKDTLNHIKVFNNNVNTIISLLFVNLLIIMGIALIGNSIYKAVGIFYNSLSNLNLTIENFISNLKVASKLKLVNEINNFLNNFYSKVISSNVLKKSAMYTTEGLLSYLIANLTSYFILIDKNNFLNSLYKVFPDNDVCLIHNKVRDINKIFNIELILVLITTLETILGFLALGIKNPIYWGVLCGIFDILPYIGTIIIFLPLILFYTLNRKFVTAVGLILLYILLMFMRQVMEAKFMSHKLKLHPLSIILSLYIGARLFGITGMFLAPIYLITVKEFVIK